MIYVTYYPNIIHPIEEIVSFCRETGLFLFEDCALAFLSNNSGSPLGSFGDAAIFCLRKFLPIPNGGVLVLNNKNIPDPPECEACSRYSTLSEFTTLILQYYMMSGSKMSRRASLTLTRAAQKIVKAVGAKRTSSGALTYHPDKVNWGNSHVSNYLLSRIDYDLVYHQRRQNYEFLLNAMKECGLAPPFSKT